MSEFLHDLDVPKHIDSIRCGQLGYQREILLVGTVDTAASELGLGVGMIQRPSPYPVHRADQIVPWERRQQAEHRVHRIREVVDFEARSTGSPRC